MLEENLFWGCLMDRGWRNIESDLRGFRAGGKNGEA